MENRRAHFLKQEMTAFSNISNEGIEGERVKDRAYDLCFGASNLQKREEIVNQQVLY